jgi:hypothetical protein
MAKVMGVTAPTDERCNWHFVIRLPTIDLSDALITEVASSVRLLADPPAVRVQLIEVLDDATYPSVSMQLRLQTAVSATDAKVLVTETLLRHAPTLDPAGMHVMVTGRP